MSEEKIIYDGGPASPCVIPVMSSHGQLSGALQQVGVQHFTGLSKREAVAMAAMQGYMAGLLAISQTFVIDLQQDQIVKVAFSIADAFLAKSKKSRGAGE